MWLGGIPVQREKSNNLVAASAQAIQVADGPVQLIVPPEGTRSGTRVWKTGFYYIAMQAQVPIVLAYMDYEKKIAGLGPVFQPTGDIEADMAAIKAFYAPCKAFPIRTCGVALGSVAGVAIIVGQVSRQAGYRARRKRRTFVPKFGAKRGIVRPRHVHGTAH
jgi:1-acyl-sn-glycerol-3-phosphate acyltransferase